MTTIHPRIHEQVRRLRELRALSQAELADLAAVSRRTIINLEQGAGVQSAVLERIADALGATIHVFPSE